MERRQFLILSSTALVGFAASDLLAAPAASEAIGSVIALAFIDGEYDDAYRGTPPVIAAESITTGEPAFLSKDAKVKILGVWRQNQREPISMTLKAYYPTELQLGGKAPYVAWNYTSTSPVIRLGGFTIPVTGEGLQLELERGTPPASQSVQGRRHASGSTDLSLRTAADLAAQSNSITLSLGHSTTAAKLRPGRYVIAILPAGAPKPDWSSFRFEPLGMKADGQGPLRPSSPLANDSVPFDYMLIRVDFA